MACHEGAYGYRKNGDLDLRRWLRAWQRELGHAQQIQVPIPLRWSLSFQPNAKNLSCALAGRALLLIGRYWRKQNPIWRASETVGKPCGFACHPSCPHLLQLHHPRPGIPLTLHLAEATACLVQLPTNSQQHLMQIQAPIRFLMISFIPVKAPLNMNRTSACLPSHQSARSVSSLLQNRLILQNNRAWCICKHIHKCFLVLSKHDSSTVVVFNLPTLSCWIYYLFTYCCIYFSVFYIHLSITHVSIYFIIDVLIHLVYVFTF